MIIFVSEKDKIFNDKKQAVTELAFCHYPVTLKIESVYNTTTKENALIKTFDSFDKARGFVLNSL